MDKLYTPRMRRTLATTQAHYILLKLKQQGAAVIRLFEKAVDQMWTTENSDNANSRINTAKGRGSSVVEQPIRNRQVVGSTPTLGSTFSK
jgi:hypothetical protein